MQLEVGAILEGKVTGITNFGAFVDIGEGKTGMVHISEVANNYVKEIRDHLQENQTVKVKVMSIGDDGKISLSIKKAVDHFTPHQPVKRPTDLDWRPQKTEASSFEDMMNRFKQTSDEKMSDLKRTLESKRGGYSRRGGYGGQSK